MSNNTLERTLSEVTREIRSNLADRVREIIKRELSKINKTKGLDKLMNRKKDIAEKISDLNNESRALDREIMEREGVIRDEITNNERLILNLYGYSSTQSILEAVRKALISLEATNYLNFLKVEKNTETMFNLAISQKEKRSVIFSLQSRDWRSLGIELPQLPHFEKFTIEKGVIELPKTAMIESK